MEWKSLGCLIDCDVEGSFSAYFIECYIHCVCRELYNNICFIRVYIEGCVMHLTSIKIIVQIFASRQLSIKYCSSCSLQRAVTIISTQFHHFTHENISMRHKIIVIPRITFANISKHIESPSKKKLSVRRFV